MEYGTLAKAKRSIPGVEERFLLGKDKDGVQYWLTTPSWDCGWYWGFGYIQTKDSHEHADRFYSEWVLGENSRLVETTFNEHEAWQLAELFKRFYILKEAAALYGRGGAHISGKNSDALKDVELAKRINEKDIPATTAEVLAILKP